MPLAAVLAAVPAVDEAFLHAGRKGAAGRCSVGLSLWEPSSSERLTPRAEEPALSFLPSRLWLVGLGRRGQAYLCWLRLLPYPDPTGLSLVLQNVDRITPSSESTSILTGQTAIGQMKARAMALWTERKDFTTAIHVRLFLVEDSPATRPTGRAGRDLNRQARSRRLSANAVPAPALIGSDAISLPNLPGLSREQSVLPGLSREQSVSAETP
jgi:hypothetical protein